MRRNLRSLNLGKLSSPTAPRRPATATNLDPILVPKGGTKTLSRVNLAPDFAATEMLIFSNLPKALQDKVWEAYTLGNSSLQVITTAGGHGEGSVQLSGQSDPWFLFAAGKDFDTHVVIY